MARGYRLLLIAGILTFWTGCLRKQQWEVAPPIWPRYVVGGVVLDSTTHNPIWEAEVILSPVQLLFPDSMQPETTWTDANGYFRFPSIPAAWLKITVHHSDYISLEGKDLVVQRDRYVELYLARRWR